MIRYLISILIISLVTGTVASAANPVVVMETPMGAVKIELFPDKAPITVKNFLGYVDDKFYDNTFFHRVIPDFMIQGGGYEPGLHKKQPNAPIKNESDNGLSNLRGTIAMARTSEPDSATCQFFINVKDNRSLDKDQAQDGVGYCVFGKVIEGMDVVDKIKMVETSEQDGQENVPVKHTSTLIRSIRRTEN